MKGKSQVNILLVNDKRVPGEGNHYCAEALSRRNKDTSHGRLSTKHLNQSSELIPADGSPSKGDFTRTQAPKYPSCQLFHWVSAGLGPHSLAKLLSLFLFLSVSLSVSPSLCFSFSVALFLSVSLSLWPSDSVQKKKEMVLRISGNNSVTCRVVSSRRPVQIFGAVSKHKIRLLWFV